MLLAAVRQSCKHGFTKWVYNIFFWSNNSFLSAIKNKKNQTKTPYESLWPEYYKLVETSNLYLNVGIEKPMDKVRKMLKFWTKSTLLIASKYWLLSLRLNTFEEEQKLLVIYGQCQMEKKKKTETICFILNIFAHTL